MPAGNRCMIVYWMGWQGSDIQEVFINIKTFNIILTVNYKIYQPVTEGSEAMSGKYRALSVGGNINRP